MGWFAELGKMAGGGAALHRRRPSIPARRVWRGGWRASRRST